MSFVDDSAFNYPVLLMKIQNAAFCKILSILCQLGQSLMAFNNASLFTHIHFDSRFPKLTFYLPYSVKSFKMGNPDFLENWCLYRPPRQALKLQRCQNSRIGYGYIRGR